METIPAFGNLKISARENVMDRTKKNLKKEKKTKKKERLMSVPYSMSTLRTIFSKYYRRMIKKIACEMVKRSRKDGKEDSSKNLGYSRKIYSINTPSAF